MKINNGNSWLRDVVLLGALITLLFGFMLGSRPLTTPDEGRYSEIPREMLINGDFVTPRLNHIIYLEKPPLFYWIQAGSLKLLGNNLWATRIPNALIALLGCLLVYVTARQLFDRRTGILASLILATSLLYFSIAHLITLDMTVTVLLSAGLFSFLL